MDMIGGLLVGAGLVLVIKNPELQWHYLLGIGIAVLIVPRLLEALSGAISKVRGARGDR